jgi:hypothetical protein
MRRALVVLTSLVLGCATPRMSSPPPGVDAKLANLRRAARYPWTDDGACVVRESDGDWATLVTRCFHTLDRSRVRFVDRQGMCPVAQSGAVTPDEMAEIVGVCLMVQPELAVGAVVVIGVVVVGSLIAAEIESYQHQREAELAIETALAVQRPQLEGHVKNIAKHLARILGRSSVGGIPPGEDPKWNKETDNHWWKEVRASLKAIQQAIKGASRKQVLRELLKKEFTEAQILEIEAALAEAARELGNELPPFLP